MPHTVASLRIGLPLAAGLLLTAAGSARADGNLPAFGGDGGTAQNFDCGPNGVLVGIEGRAGSWMDKVGGICTRINKDGAWIGSRFSTGAAGDGGDVPFKAQCSSGWAVSGVAASYGWYVNNVRVYCRKLGDHGILQGDAVSEAVVGGSSSGEHHYPRHDCADNRPVRGFRAWHASDVDRLRFSCSLPQTYSVSVPTEGGGGATLRGLVRRNYLAATPAHTVYLSSGNPAMAAVPTTVTFAAGSSSADFSITTAPVSAPIGVQISATDGHDPLYTASDTLVVRPARLAGIDWMFEPLLGLPAWAKLTLDGTPASSVTVSLFSSNSGVLGVPPTAQIPAGDANGVKVSLQKGTTGCTTLRATLGATTVSRDFRLHPARNHFGHLTLDSTIYINGSTEAQVELDEPLSATQSLSLPISTSVPGVLAVPPVVFFLPGSKTATFKVGHLAPGCVVVTVGSGASSFGRTVSVYSPLPG